MKLHTLEIPEDPVLLAEWLEGHLMGLDLGQLVTELEVLGVAGEGATNSLQTVLGDQVSTVLQLGLRSLSRDQFRQMLRQPKLLLALQSRILKEGGPYWMTVPLSDEQEENSRKTWQYIERVLNPSAPQTVSSPASGSRKPRLLAGAGWLAAMAAGVALVVLGLRTHSLEERLGKQSEAIGALRKELQAQQALAANRAEPPDLPERSADFVSTEGNLSDLPENAPQTPAGPSDLPGNDPKDLPET